MQREFYKSHEFWLMMLMLCFQIANKQFTWGFEKDEIFSMFGLAGSYTLGRQMLKSKVMKKEE